jgi:hypothetical protein
MVFYMLKNRMPKEDIAKRVYSGSIYHRRFSGHDDGLKYFRNCG